MLVTSSPASNIMMHGRRALMHESQARLSYSSSSCDLIQLNAVWIPGYDGIQHNLVYRWSASSSVSRSTRLERVQTFAVSVLVAWRVQRPSLAEAFVICLVALFRLHWGKPLLP